jgi:hypothetical protein
MTGQLPVQCLACARRSPTESPTDTSTAVICEAYPGGIPDEILFGADHRTPRGDERDGLLFERAEGPEADRAWVWWERLNRRSS